MASNTTICANTISTNKSNTKKLQVIRDSSLESGPNIITFGETSSVGIGPILNLKYIPNINDIQTGNINGSIKFMNRDLSSSSIINTLTNVTPGQEESTLIFSVSDSNLVGGGHPFIPGSVALTINSPVNNPLGTEGPEVLIHSNLSFTSNPTYPHAPNGIIPTKYNIFYNTATVEEELIINKFTPIGGGIDPATPASSTILLKSTDDSNGVGVREGSCSLKINSGNLGGVGLEGNFFIKPRDKNSAVGSVNIEGSFQLTNAEPQALDTSSIKEVVQESILGAGNQSTVTHNFSCGIIKMYLNDDSGSPPGQDNRIAPGATVEFGFNCDKIDAFTFNNNASIIVANSLGVDSSSVAVSSTVDVTAMGVGFCVFTVKNIGSSTIEELKIRYTILNIGTPEIA